MHTYNKEGRDPKIESYIRALADWVITHIKPNKDMAFVDIGCDYGFAMECFAPLVAQTHGIEPFRMSRDVFPNLEPFIYENKLSGATILDISSKLLSAKKRLGTIYWMNHVLEHLEDPIGALRLLNDAPFADYIVLATPDALRASEDFVYRKSHLTVYTEGWYRHTAPIILTNFELLSLKSECLRDQCDELWAIYKRKTYEP
jgi:hypothetical protein